MIEVETQTRKWGNSLGISIPKAVVKKANLKPNKRIRILIQEEESILPKIFGTLKIKESTQKLLDDARKGER